MLVLEFHSDSERDNATDRGFIGSYRFLPESKFNDSRYVENSHWVYQPGQFRGAGKKLAEPCTYNISAADDLTSGFVFRSLIKPSFLNFLAKIQESFQPPLSLPLRQLRSLHLQF